MLNKPINIQLISNHKQNGLTLIEILVSLAISMFLLLGLSSFFINNLKAQSDNVKLNTLNQELRQAVMLISKDLKRAGYSGDNVTNSFNTIRVCKSDNESIPCDSIEDPDDAAQADKTYNDLCILYAYDRNKNGGIPSGNELGGVRLLGNKVFYRTWGNNLQRCKIDADNSWDQLTSNTIKITKLQFCYLNANTDTNAKSLPPTRCDLLPTGGQKINNLVLSIEAELESDSSVKTKFIEVIRLYNSPINAS